MMQSFAKRSVAILVFNDAEVLDFAGPFEVFSVASQLHDYSLYDVSIVASAPGPIIAVNGLKLLPDVTLNEARSPDIIVISGGAGTRVAMSDPAILEWLRDNVPSAEMVMSVCSGARILATLGYLSGLQVVTHRQVFDHVQELAPAAIMRPDLRFTDNGRLITTGGISAGIDGAFHVVARNFGLQVARATADYMEYAWVPIESIVHKADPSVAEL